MRLFREYLLGPIILWASIFMFAYILANYGHIVEGIWKMFVFTVIFGPLILKWIIKHQELNR